MGLGCVLMQQGKVIAFASRQLKVHEKNFPTHDVESEVMVFDLKIWRHYFYGVHVYVYNDYKSLQCVFTKKRVEYPMKKMVKLLKDYDMNVLYHPGKADVVVDALIHMTMGSVSHVEEAKKDLVRDVHRMARLGVRLEDSPDGCFMVHHNSESSLVVEVNSKQHLDQPFMKLKETVIGKFNESFSLGGDGVLRYQGRLCVPKVDDLRNRILEESHGSRYSIYRGSSNMYQPSGSVFFGRFEQGHCGVRC